VPDVTEPDEGDLEEFEAAMMLADALASLAVLADAGASRRELRQAITAAIDDLPETAAWLVGVALSVADPPALAITARRSAPRRPGGHLRLVPPL
jgi:hypothetical protein